MGYYLAQRHHRLVECVQGERWCIFSKSTASLARKCIVASPCVVVCAQTISGRDQEPLLASSYGQDMMWRHQKGWCFLLSKQFESWYQDGTKRWKDRRQHLCWMSRQFAAAQFKGFHRIDMLMSNSARVVLVRLSASSLVPRSRTCWWRETLWWNGSTQRSRNIVKSAMALSFRFEDKQLLLKFAAF